MSSENGFIDLRLNTEGSNSGNESFWPSFTDIMTVIVMIFLIAMVVLLIRNMELVQQLRATMEAERMAAELARTTGEEKESISLRLINTENQLSELRLELLKMQDIRAKQLATIKDQMVQIDQVTNQRDQLRLDYSQLKQQNVVLENTQQQLTLDKQQLENRLTTTSDQMANVQQALASLKLQHNLTLEQLTDLQQSYEDKKSELEQASNRIALSDQELSELRGDYDKLKVKYDKLVRPARTPAGKYVVEVRYAKAGGQYQIAVKTPEQEKFTEITQNALEKKLDRLKAKDPKKLYIKVIFPENSGLSYSEAWEFTSHLHKHYDYYFQDSDSR
ncbi:MAG: hypothetical protein PVG66_13705 [Chromatiales bacterium]|jgi:chromosome segregation ATPase